MSKLTSTTTAALGLALIALPGCLALQAADPYADVVAATPQRPTVNNNTQTTYPGTVEIETGLVYDPNDSFDLPLTLKYGVAENGEVFIARDIYKRLNQPGVEDRGTGDTLLGTRWRLWEGDPDAQTGEANSFALEFGVGVPTGSRTKGNVTLGNGKDAEAPFSQDEWLGYLAAIVDGHLGGLAWTTYYRISSIGQEGDHSRDAQHTAAFAMSHTLGGDVTGFAEVAGWYLRGHRLGQVSIQNPLFTTVGVAFAERPDRVWDVSFTKGLNDDAPDFLLQAGVTINMGGASADG